jgi:hypothetical protein
LVQTWHHGLNPVAHAEALERRAQHEEATPHDAGIVLDVEVETVQRGGDNVEKVDTQCINIEGHWRWWWRQQLAVVVSGVHLHDARLLVIASCDKLQLGHRQQVELQGVHEEALHRDLLQQVHDLHLLRNFRHQRHRSSSSSSKREAPLQLLPSCQLSLLLWRRFPPLHY